MNADVHVLTVDKRVIRMAFENLLSDANYFDSLGVSKYNNVDLTTTCHVQYLSLKINYTVVAVVTCDNLKVHGNFVWSTDARMLTLD